MMTDGEKFKRFIEEKGVPDTEVGRILGVSSQQVSNYYASKKFQRPTLMKIKKGYPDFDLDAFDSQVENVFKKTPRQISSNAKLIGDLFDELEYEDEQGNTKFREISPGIYKMKVRLVSEHARAGFLRGFKDPEYDEELPFTEVTVSFYHKGSYLAFEVSGDSMDDGTIKCIPHGTIITGREVKRENWTSKLHSHKYPNWVFVHQTEGILVKQIKHQNLETNEVTLTSLNPNKELYPDFVINLADVYKIFNVVKRELQD